MVPHPSGGERCLNEPSSVRIVDLEVLTSFVSSVVPTHLVVAAKQFYAMNAAKELGPLIVSNAVITAMTVVNQLFFVRIVLLAP